MEQCLLCARAERTPWSWADKHAGHSPVNFKETCLHDVSLRLFLRTISQCTSTKIATKTFSFLKISVCSWIKKKKWQTHHVHALTENVLVFPGVSLFESHTPEHLILFKTPSHNSPSPSWPCSISQIVPKLSLCHSSNQRPLCCCSLVAKLCPTLCDPVDCNMPGFSVLQYLPEFAQTHVCWVGDAISPSHLLLPLGLLPSVFPSIRVFSNELAVHIRWPKYWNFSSASVLPMNIQGWFPLGLTILISLLSKGFSRLFSTTVWKPFIGCDLIPSFWPTPSFLPCVFTAQIEKSACVFPEEVM